ncbi:MAG TPA: exosortase A, partial [Acetobacteraceae bacterium]|nr:exosortase A [Acetobacteraceae bacterium]
AAVRVWDSSTAYGHCWLILPIAAFLAWERRGQAAAARLAPRPALALLAVPLVVVWLAADLLGIMEGRQLAAIGFVEVALLAVFGPALWWALAAALLYLVFLVPFGAFLTPALQNFTTGFILYGLGLFGIPHQAAGNHIEIPEGLFYVAEACAGLRFLIASIAFGVLYAVTMFTSPWRRVAFIAAACVVPVVANGFRALGIVLLGHWLGSPEAAATDHILYGWLFISLVIVALAAAGMPFREAPPRPPPPAPLPSPDLRMRAVYAVWPVLLLAAAGPALMLGVNGRRPAPTATAVLIAPAGCAETARYSVDGGLAQDFACVATAVTTRFYVLPRGANPARVMTLAQAQPAALLPNADLDAGKLEIPGANPQAWVLARADRAAQAAAYLVYVNAGPVLGGLRDRLRLARGMIDGGDIAPAVLAVAVTHAAGDPLVPLRAFLAAQGDLTGRVANALQRMPQK